MLKQSIKRKLNDTYRTPCDDVVEDADDDKDNFQHQHTTYALVGLHKNNKCYHFIFHGGDVPRGEKERRGRRRGAGKRRGRGRERMCYSHK